METDNQRRGVFNFTMNPDTKYYYIKHAKNEITYFKFEDEDRFMFDTVGLWSQPKPGWILINEGFMKVYMDEDEKMIEMSKEEIFLWLL